ncbi:multidrug ABC transporter permease [Thermoleptolyngbya sichuanensis A183]|uniref:Multidrug ABC transporter permease n=1 Tax=Thermoleptolyngbya sichuanensis A183 TaxID=2737172 RepID=A0A6M8BC04_9CYAN|nr:ABC-2 family transporter protein [Thermoleptolyngbya sichuanensis]QKD81111.1 multidrug ABC transporter permease [Thermoleptolyngbya sichuanensis A183]
MLRTARTLLSVYYAYMVEYRAELILWVLAGSLPLILMGVWMEASQGGQFGLSPVEFARYFLAVFLVRQFTIVWVVWDFERDVVEGKLSSRLLQPLDPGWHYFASHLGERFARVPFAFVLVELFFWLYPQAFWLPSVGDFLLGALATALAFVLRYVMQYTVSMLAFWIEKASAIEQIWFLIYLFFSGVVAPLEVFPPLARQIVEWTPLPYLVYFPASIFVGLPGNRLHGFLITLAWIVLFFWLNRWLWRRGLRHYSGMGA